MSMYEQGKKAADEGAEMARDVARKTRVKAEQTMEAAQEGMQMAGDGARQMNLKLIEIMRTNTETFFEFAEEMANAKDPGKFLEIWSKYTQRQMEWLVKQSQDFAALGQRLAVSNIDSLAGRIR